MGTLLTSEVSPVVVADFDHDGRPDIFAVIRNMTVVPGDTYSPGESTYQVRLNQGSRNFLDRSPVPWFNLGRAEYQNLFAIDMNLDGSLDVVTAPPPRSHWRTPRPRLLSTADDPGRGAPPSTQAQVPVRAHRGRIRRYGYLCLSPQAETGTTSLCPIKSSGFKLASDPSHVKRWPCSLTVVTSKCSCLSQVSSGIRDAATVLTREDTFSEGIR